MYYPAHVHKCKRRRHADRLINEARQRFLRLAPTSRPADQPHNILGLFGPVELLQLALDRRWPLPSRDLRFITGRRPSSDAPSATTPVGKEAG